MTTGVVLTRWSTDGSVHMTASRSAGELARSLVRGYVGYDERPNAPMARRELARNGLALILAFGDPLEVADGLSGAARPLGAFAVGNQSRATLTGLGGHQLGVQVELTSAGALALVGAVGGLNDSAVPIDEVLGGFGTGLVERLAAAASWEDRFNVLDEALGRRLLGGCAVSLSPEVAWLKRQLVCSGGRARVEPLMDETGWSRRLVTERFGRQIGVTPKAFARVQRFSTAVALLRDRRTGPGLAAIAHDCGYYDQAHLNRDFAALAGCSPTAYLAETSGEPAIRFFQDDELAPSLP